MSDIADINEAAFSTLLNRGLLGDFVYKPLKDSTYYRVVDSKTDWIVTVLGNGSFNYNFTEPEIHSAWNVGSNDDRVDKFLEIITELRPNDVSVANEIVKRIFPNR